MASINTRSPPIIIWFSFSDGSTPQLLSELLSKEKLKKLGEPFYTTKKNGNGLGLMVSFKIIENHNGRVYVESELNKGTTFNILLPAKTA